MDTIALECLLLWDAVCAEWSIQCFAHQLAYVGSIQLWGLAFLYTAQSVFKECSVAIHTGT